MANNSIVFDDLFSIILDRAARALVYRLQNVFLKAGHDITVEQWMVMLLLWQEDGQFQQQLADGINKDKATVTRQIDGLEKRNLIVRVPDRVDRRQKRVHLTNRGREMEGALIPLGIENALTAQSDIPPGHLDICRDGLKKVYHNLTTK